MNGAPSYQRTSSIASATVRRRLFTRAKSEPLFAHAILPFDGGFIGEASSEPERVFVVEPSNSSVSQALNGPAINDPVNFELAAHGRLGGLRRHPEKSVSVLASDPHILADFDLDHPVRLARDHALDPGGAVGNQNLLHRSSPLFDDVNVTRRYSFVKKKKQRGVTFL